MVQGCWTGHPFIRNGLTSTSTRLLRQSSARKAPKSFPLQRISSVVTGTEHEIAVFDSYGETLACSFCLGLGSVDAGRCPNYRARPILPRLPSVGLKPIPLQRFWPGSLDDHMPATLHEVAPQIKVCVLANPLP